MSNMYNSKQEIFDDNEKAAVIYYEHHSNRDESGWCVHSDHYDNESIYLDGITLNDLKAMIGSGEIYYQSGYGDPYFEIEDDEEFQKILMREENIQEEYEEEEDDQD